MKKSCGENFCRLVVILLVRLDFAFSYPTGAPSFACLPLTPAHGDSSETETENFEISIEHTHPQIYPIGGYISGATYEIHLKSNNGKIMKGFALKSLGSDGEFLGNFSAPLPDYVRELESCGRMNSLTHSQIIGSDQLVFSWSVPKEQRGKGCITFQATVVEEFSVWYTLSRTVCEAPGNEIEGCLSYIDTNVETSGTVQSVNYYNGTNNYFNSLDCKTYFSSSDSHTLLIQFEHFDLEDGISEETTDPCPYDKLTVIGEDDVVEATLCGKYEGDALKTLKYDFTDKALTLDFHTDQLTVATGYRAWFYSVPIDSGCINSKTVKEAGEITSLNYPDQYLFHLDCSTFILGPAKSYRILLEINSLDVERGTEDDGSCDNDYLFIDTGTVEQGPFRYCGNLTDYDEKQLKLSSAEHIVEIDFVSNGINEFSGFSLNMYLVDSCSATSYSSSSGEIMSPNYQGYYLNNQNCTFKIEVTENYAVMLKFTFFDLEEGDYVEINGGKESPEIIDGNWGGRENELVFLSTTNEMTIRFVSDESGAGGGFEATYSSVEAGAGEIIYDQCPPSWTYIQDLCYGIGEEYYTWSEAKEACEAIGATLASVLTYDEMLDLNKLIQNSDSYLVSEAYWLGASDTEHQTDWVWIDGSDFSYTDWFTGWSQYDGYNSQPSDDGSGRQDCLEVKQSFSYPIKGQGVADRVYWNDQECSKKNKYICQRPSFGATSTPIKEESCDKHYNQSSGYIASPNFPSDYSNGEDCEIVIESPSPEYVVIIEFHYFWLEEEEHCNYDHLEISTVGYEQDSIRYCGDRRADLKLLRYTSPSNIVQLTFFSDQSKTSIGFNATYYFEKETLLCGERTWIQGDGNCYLAVNTESSWNRAQSNCEENGGSLATILDFETNEFIITSLMSSANYSQSSLYWLAARGENVEDEWVWEGGEELVYFKNLDFRDWFLGWENEGYYSKQPDFDTDNNATMCLAFKQTFDRKYAYDGNEIADSLYWSVENCQENGRSVCQKSAITSSVSYFNHTIKNGGEEFHSLNYPNSYENDIVQTMYIEVADGYRVELHFSSFSLEFQENCLYDYVLVDDGVNTVRYCGERSSSELEDMTFWSLTSRLQVVLVTDYSITEKGFAAWFRSLDSSSCVGIENSAGELGKSLSSFNYPERYLNGLECSSHITAKDNYRVLLRFDTFHLEDSVDCSRDYVEIWLDSNYKTSLRRCGDQTSSVENMRFLSNENTMTLNFVTDNSEVNQGYLAQYYAVPDVTEVNETLQSKVSTNNSLTSVNFPASYPSKTDYLTILETLEGYHIQLSFALFEVDGSSDCQQDKVIIYDYDYSGANQQVISTLCGNLTREAEANDLVFSSTFNQLSVRLLTSDSHDQNYVGFKADYFSFQELCADCNYQGYCIYNNEKLFKICQCYLGYTGNSCSENVEKISVVSSASFVLNDPVLIGAICAAFLIFVVFVIVVVRLRSKSKRKNESQTQNNIESTVSRSDNQKNSFVNSVFENNEEVILKRPEKNEDKLEVEDDDVFDKAESGELEAMETGARSNVCESSTATQIHESKTNLTANEFPVVSASSHGVNNLTERNESEVIVDPEIGFVPENLAENSALLEEQKFQTPPSSPEVQR